jgi:hypothetical protein
MPGSFHKSNQSSGDSGDINHANFFPVPPQINEEISISDRFKNLRRMSAIVRKTSLPENHMMSGGEDSNEV